MTQSESLMRDHNVAQASRPRLSRKNRGRDARATTSRECLKRISWCLLPCSSLAAFAAEPSAPAPTIPDLPRVPFTDAAKAGDTFKTLNGFRMDLLAAEPLLTDPVALAYDEDGRAFVAEMNDYPYTDAVTHEAWKDNTTDAPIGRVRMLVDTDGDGDFDKSTLFAEGLSWPTGVACWKGGIFVAATPDVWYFKDTDDDGVADVKRKVFTGFRKFNVQAVMNNFAWGLDNCLYGAGGGNGGEITVSDHPDQKPIILARSDFRFDPNTNVFNTLPGGARFGNTFDDWGNRFVCNIRNPAQHIVVETRYLARNPYAPVASVVHDVARSGDALPVYRISPVEAWRDFRASRLASERSTQPRSELVAGGVVTSASGITIYRGDAYPAEYRGQFFLGEVANNLIHRQNIRPNGVTFVSKRIDEKVEFAASTDVWFRPVNFINAPDGTLHVLDMYREVIEHPWSIPDDIRAKLDLRSGADRGRLYRLTPPNFVAPKSPQLSKASVVELVALLGHRNAWWRETAQRLLVEKQDKSAVEPLRALLASAQEPLARLHALWTLEGLGSASVEDIRRAMDDATAGVRENAIRVAERHLKEAGPLIDRVIAATEDGDIRVRFQAALTLGETQDPRVAKALAALLRRDAGDSWVVVAVLSAAAERATEMLAELSQDVAFTKSEAGVTALRQLSAVAGATNKPAGVMQVLAAPDLSPAARVEAATGLGEGLRRRQLPLRTAGNAAGSQAIGDLLAQAMKTAGDDAGPVADRVRAIRLLGFDDLDRTKKLLSDLLDPRHPPEVQRAAVTALAGVNAPEVGPLLLSRWKAYTPAVRAEVIQAMLGYANRLPTLLDALEAGRVSVIDIPASRKTALMKHPTPGVSARAIKLFGADGQAAGRKEVLDKYAATYQLKGDAKAGHKIYETACASCHKLGDQGSDVGPNLATVRQWGPEQILVNVLDPNREVAPTFAEYVVQLTDGETLSGIISEETATSITLKMAGGATRLLSRQNVKRMAGSRLSLMPEGLETGITPQQMADLISFLRGK